MRTFLILAPLLLTACGMRGPLSLPPPATSSALSPAVPPAATPAANDNKGGER